MKKEIKNTFIVKELKIKYSQKKVSNLKFDTEKNLTTPENVWKYTKDYFENETVESMLVLFLNTQNKITGYHVVSKGTLDSSIVHPREVFKGAILSNCNNIILVHNHPSGKVNPSSQDNAITKRIKEAGNLLGIKLIDHVIVTDDNFYSYEAQRNI